MTVILFRWMEVNHIGNAHDAVYHPFFRGIPPSTDKLL